MPDEDDVPDLNLVREKAKNLFNYFLAEGFIELNSDKEYVYTPEGLILLGPLAKT